MLKLTCMFVSTASKYQFIPFNTLLDFYTPSPPPAMPPFLFPLTSFIFPKISLIFFSIFIYHIFHIFHPFNFRDVPEVLNVYIIESKKKITFEKEKVIFFNTYLNFNLFNLIVVNIL